MSLLGGRRQCKEVSRSESEIEIGPAERAVVLGIQLFRGLGILLLAFFVLGTLSSLTDLRLRNPATELRFASAMTDRIPMALLGMVLLLCHPRFLRWKAEAIGLRTLTFLALGLAVFYLLLIPVTMNAGAQLFRKNSFQLGERIKEQVDRAKKVQEATMSLTPEQQEGMVTRYNRGNPQKRPVTVKEFLRILDEEVKSQEAKLEAERKSLLNSQQRNLYTAQFIQSAQCFLGAAAFILLYWWTGWSRGAGQYALREAAGWQRRG